MFHAIVVGIIRTEFKHAPLTELKKRSLKLEWTGRDPMARLTAGDWLWKVRDDSVSVFSDTVKRKRPRFPQFYMVSTLISLRWTRTVCTEDVWPCLLQQFRNLSTKLWAAFDRKHHCLQCSSLRATGELWYGQICSLLHYRWMEMSSRFSRRSGGESICWVWQSLGWERSARHMWKRHWEKTAKQKRTEAFKVNNDMQKVVVVDRVTILKSSTWRRK